MEEDAEDPEYNRSETINGLLQTVWLINMLPLGIAMFFFSSIAFAVTFPLSIVVWIAFGKRPIHRTPPANFFFLLFWGAYMNVPLHSEMKFTRIVFYLMSDFRMVVDNPYRDLFRLLVRGRAHPAAGFAYPPLARLAGLAMYALSVMPFISLGWGIYGATAG